MLIVRACVCACVCVTDFVVRRVRVCVCTQIWDTRSNVPLATLASHTDKTLCVAWVGEAGLVSGGADCKLLSYSTGQHITVTP